MKKFNIRVAQEKDIPAMLEIETSHKMTPHWNREQFVKEFHLSCSRLYVAESEGKVGGYLGLWLVPPETQITTVAVHPHYLREGLGTRLLESGILQARQMGFSVVTLEVNSQNESALRLYKKLGFKIVGSRSNFYNDGEDAILMELQL
ncbi:MAG: ribosomal protein S18-alanine N-acetyltransferase [Elusimicrobia bacterium]|nr:ribosomal protein S18-alanine N-acetyltransferase [Elusimicrobiota bacterium]